MQKKTIFLIDDEEDILELLSMHLRDEGNEVKTEGNGERALRILQEEVFDVVITDLMINGVDGIDVLKKTKEVSPRTEVIIITGHASVDTAIQAMKLGAFDYINKPVNLGELQIVIRKAYERQRLVAEVKNLRSQIKGYSRFVNIVATSPKMQKVLGIVKRIAGSDATVLIEGESGTGKEVIARAIHNHSTRSEGPFVAVNCGALPDSLLESELFGHMKGAFTGANITKKGLFEEANGGTIFLDEIGETSPQFQVKLLRVLQENEIRRVGDTKDIPIDARVLAASNTVLRQLVDEKRFRQDLFFRLRVIPLYIPPLRERREDIAPLAKFFVERFCKKTGRQVVKLKKDAIKKLEDYEWPGNVRELENAIERSMTLAAGDELTAEDTMLEFYTVEKADYDFSCMSLKDLEKLHIKNVLGECLWNQKKAAGILGIGYNTLWRKIKEYKFEKNS